MKRKHNERKLIRLALVALLAGSLLYAPDVAMAGVTTTVTDADLGANNQTVYGNNNGTAPNASDSSCDMTNNHLTVNLSGIKPNNVYGCFVWSSTTNTAVTGNILEINSGDFTSTNNISGVHKESGSPPVTLYSNNIVHIKGGTYKNTIYGVYINTPAANTEVSNNHLIIAGGSFQDTVRFQIRTDSGTASVFKNNSISILVPLTTNGSVMFTGGGSNSTLNVGAVGVKVGYVNNVTDYNFYLPANVKANDKMLVITGDDATYVAGANIGAAVVKGAKLSKGDTVDLMHNANGLIGDFNTTELTTDKTTTGLTLDTTYKLEVKRKDNYTIYTEITDVQEEVNPERTSDVKSLVETRAATATYLNAGSDLLASQGFSQAADAVALDMTEKAKGATPGTVPVSMFTPFFTVGGSSLRAESGSYVETKGFGMNLGFAREIKNSQGKLLFGPIVEYGGGNYDSYLDDGTHGEGGAHYFGVGLMARQINNDGFYYEGSLRGGRVNSDYKSVLDGIGNVNYDSSSNYWAAHLGFGKIFDIGHNNIVDGYCKYFFSHQGGDTATIHLEGLDDEKGVFDAVNSHRLRIGARLTHKINETNRIYGGLAYQYEFGGEARAHFNGNSVPSPSIKGSSGMLELGWKFKPDNGPMTLDLGLNGWVGKQRGGSVHLGATWTF